MADSDRNPEDVLIWLGPCVLAFTAIGYNLMASRKGIPTISMGVRKAAYSSNGAIIVGAAIGGLCAHWFLDRDDHPIISG